MRSLIFRLFQNIGLITVSLGLLYGGVAILNTSIPFWSLVYGIPAVFLGIITSLISFNEIAKNPNVGATEYHQIQCRVCGRMTLAPMLIESIVCPDCQYKMAVRLQLGVLLFFILVAIPVSYHLARQAQNITQHARTPQSSPICAVGQWSPSSCRCGTWENKHTCAGAQLARNCGSVSYCCQPKGSTWNCEVQPSP